MIAGVSLGPRVLSKAFFLALTAAFAMSTGAFAADMGAPEPAPPPVAAAPAPLPARLLDPRPLGYEVRLGAFAHAVGSVEKGTASVSLDLVFPRWIPPQSAWWDVLIPRAYVGAIQVRNVATGVVGEQLAVALHGGLGRWLSR